ncbi:MAG: hypothetical protein M1830_005872 [Pleopsidium flavum]|nr:MAG: hypothetical protein M1830_005872 [Pleopsidium flavum]
MGFTAGLLGGITLTSSVLYLSLAIHQRNRIHQASLLQQQFLLLTSIVQRLPERPPPPRYVLDKPSIVETVKDAWNEDIEGAVRWAQGVKWERVREGLEARVVGMWRRAKEGMKESP